MEIGRNGTIIIVVILLLIVVFAILMVVAFSSNGNNPDDNPPSNHNQDYDDFSERTIGDVDDNDDDNIGRNDIISGADTDSSAPPPKNVKFGDIKVTIGPKGNLKTDKVKEDVKAKTDKPKIETPKVETKVPKVEDKIEKHKIEPPKVEAKTASPKAEPIKEVPKVVKPPTLMKPKAVVVRSMLPPKIAAKPVGNSIIVSGKSTGQDSVSVTKSSSQSIKVGENYSSGATASSDLSKHVEEPIIPDVPSEFSAMPDRLKRSDPRDFL